MNNVIKIFKGESRAIELRIRDSKGDPVDLGEQEIAGTLKGCPEPVALTQDNFEVVDGSRGQLIMNLTPEHTSALHEGVSSFDVHVGLRIVRFENVLQVEGDL